MFWNNDEIQKKKKLEEEKKKKLDEQNRLLKREKRKAMLLALKKKAFNLKQREESDKELEALMNPGKKKDASGQLVKKEWTPPPLDRGLGMATAKPGKFTPPSMGQPTKGPAAEAKKNGLIADKGPRDGGEGGLSGKGGDTGPKLSRPF